MHFLRFLFFVSFFNHFFELKPVFKIKLKYFLPIFSIASLSLGRIYYIEKYLIKKPSIYGFLRQFKKNEKIEQTKTFTFYNSTETSENKKNNPQNLANIETLKYKIFFGEKTSTTETSYNFNEYALSLSSLINNKLYTLEELYTIEKFNFKLYKKITDIFIINSKNKKFYEIQTKGNPLIFYIFVFLGVY
jgi:hypothetical protein